MKKGLLFVALITFLTNCKPKDIIKESAYSFTVEEHTKNGTVLGKIDATANKGSLAYELVSQSTAGALSVNANGEIVVADFTKLDFETTPKFTAKVNVKDDKVTNEVTVTLNLTNVEVPKDKLMAYFPFNGNTNDESGNSRNGTIVTNALNGRNISAKAPIIKTVDLTADRNGKTESAYTFTNGAISIPKFGDNETQFTICAWVKESIDNLDFRAIVVKGDNSYTEYSMGIFDENTERATTPAKRIRTGYNVGEGSHYFYSNKGLTKGNWHHVAYVYNDKLVTIYIDGEKVSDYSAKSAGIYYNNKSVIIGAVNTANYFGQFKGDIDDVAFYGRILSDDELKLVGEGKY